MLAARKNPAFLAFLALSVLFLQGCEQRAPLAESITVETVIPQAGRANLVTLPRPPIIAAPDAEGLSLARLTAQRTRWADLYRRPDARLVSVDALPFLYRTAEGQRFLEAEVPRAIARGEPPEICPATVTTTDAPGIALPDLAEQTLDRCLARLRDHPGCGCRLLAIGDFLTVPREEMSFATGTTARLRAPELGLDAVLVAEKTGERTVLLRGLAGPVGEITRDEDRTVTVALRGLRFTGRTIPVGYRRGRIAERIYATDASGRRLSLLIGFSPDELAKGAAGFLAWPAGL